MRLAAKREAEQREEQARSIALQRQMNETQPSELDVCRYGCQIYQVGTPRSASTWQWYLLCSLLRMKALRWHGSTRRVWCHFGNAGSVQGLPWSGQVHVIKTHHLREIYPMPRQSAANRSHNSSEHHNIFVFVSRRAHVPAVSRSGFDAGVFSSRNQILHDTELASLQSAQPDARVIFVQEYDTFIRRGLTAVHETYKPLFQLTDMEAQHVCAHMRWWQVLRTCCGAQGSIDTEGRRAEVARFIKSKGRTNTSAAANLTQAHHLEDWDYPACEMYNLDAVLRGFSSTTLARATPNGSYGYSEHIRLVPGSSSLNAQPQPASGFQCAQPK